MAGDVSVGDSAQVTTQMPDPAAPASPAVVVVADDQPKRLSVEAIRNRRSGLTTTQLNEQLDAYSERTSTNLRSLVLGDLGLTWLLLLGKDETRAITAGISEYTLLSIAGFCVLALSMDVVQYMFGEHAVEDAFDRAEKSETGTAGYNRRLFSYRAQLWSYRAKQVLAAVATTLLLVSLGGALI